MLNQCPLGLSGHQLLYFKLIAWFWVKRFLLGVSLETEPAVGTSEASPRTGSELIHFVAHCLFRKAFD